MQRPIATSKFQAALSVLALALIALLSASCASSPSATASDNQAAPADQSAAPRQRYWATVTHVKPGLNDAFQEFYQKETKPAYEKVGYKQVSVYTTATFGELGEFVTIRPIESEKQFDEPNFLVKALGEAGAKAWIAKRSQLIAGSRSFLMQSRPELSIPLPPNQTAKLAFVFRQSIAPGRAADFESFIRNDALPIIKKAAPKGYFVAKVGTGGDTEEYHTVVLVDSFAEHEKWEQALPKEGYGQVAAKRAGIVMHRESAVYRYLPELSLPQPATQAAK